MAEDKSVALALRRLAILENQPLRCGEELIDWYKLRQWVLSDKRLLEQYREQHYFMCAEEVTKNEIAPKNSSSIFSRFLTFLGIKK